MCNCQKLNNCVEVTSSRDIFVKEFTKLDSSLENWCELYLCKICNQHWIIEQGGEYDRRSNKAYKIASSNNWQNYDTRPYLAEFFINYHGGLSETKCIHFNCEKMALNNTAVCVVHGHSEVNWNSST